MSTRPNSVVKTANRHRPSMIVARTYVGRNGDFVVGRLLNPSVCFSFMPDRFPILLRNADLPVSYRLEGDLSSRWDTGLSSSVEEG
jgi:hypothetical protein